MADIFEVDLNHGFNILMNVNVTIINNSKQLRKDKSVEQLITKVANSGSFEVARFINIKLDHLDTFLENLSPISLKLQGILQELSVKKPEKDAKIFQLSRIRLSYPDAYVHTEPSPLSQKRFGGSLEDVDFLPKKIKIVHARHVTEKSRFPKSKYHKFNESFRNFHSQLDDKKEMVEQKIIEHKNSLLNMKRRLNHKRMHVTPPVKRLKMDTWGDKEEYNEEDDPLDDIESTNEELQKMIGIHQSISSLQNIINEDAKLSVEENPLPFEDYNEMDKEEQLDENESKKEARTLRKWFSQNKQFITDVVGQKVKMSEMIEKGQKSDLELFDLDFNYTDDQVIEQKQNRLHQLRNKYPTIENIKDPNLLNLLQDWNQLNQIPDMAHTINRSGQLLGTMRKQHVKQYFNSASKNPHLVRAMKIMENIPKAKTQEEKDKFKKESLEFVKRAKPSERRSFFIARKNLDFLDELDLPDENKLREMENFMKEEEFNQEQERLNDLELEMRKKPYNRNYFGDKLRKYFNQEDRKIYAREDENEQYDDDDDEQEYREMMEEIKKDEEELKMELVKNEEELMASPEKMYGKYSNVLFNRKTLSKVWDSLHLRTYEDNDVDIMLRNPEYRTNSTAYTNAVNKFKMLELLMEQRENFSTPKIKQVNGPYINYLHHGFNDDFYNTNDQIQALESYIMKYFGDNFHNIESDPTSAITIIEDLVNNLATKNAHTVKETSMEDYKRILKRRYDRLIDSNVNPNIQRDVYDVDSQKSDLKESVGWRRSNIKGQFVKHFYNDKEGYLEKMVVTPSSPRTFNSFMEGVEKRNAMRNFTSGNARSRIDYFHNKRTSDEKLEEKTGRGLRQIKKDNPLAYKLIIADHRSPPEMMVVNHPEKEILDPMEFKMLSRPLFIEPHQDFSTISHNEFQTADKINRQMKKDRKFAGCTLVDGTTKHHFPDFCRHPEGILLTLQINHGQCQELSMELLNRIMSSFVDENDDNPIHHMQHLERNCKPFFRRFMQDMHYNTFNTDKLDEFSKILLGSCSLGHSLSDSIRFPRNKHHDLRKMFQPQKKSSTSAVSLVPLTGDNRMIAERLQTKSGKSTLVHSISPQGSGIMDVVKPTALMLMGGYGAYKGQQFVNTVGESLQTNPEWQRERANELYEQITNRMGFNSQTQGNLAPPPQMMDTADIWKQNAQWPWPPSSNDTGSYDGFRPPMSLSRPDQISWQPPRPATEGRYDKWMVTGMINKAIEFLSSNALEGLVRVGVLPPMLKDTINMLWLYFAAFSQDAGQNPIVMGIMLYSLRGKLMNILKTIPKPFAWIFNKVFGNIFKGQGELNKTSPTPDTTQIHSANPLGMENLPPELNSFLQEISKNFESKPSSNIELTTRALNVLGYPPRIAGYILKQITTMGMGQIPTVIAHGLTPSYIAKDMIPKMLKAYPPFYKVLYDTNFVNSKMNNNWSSPTWKTMGHLGPSLATLLSQTNLNRQLGTDPPPSSVDSYKIPLGINSRPDITTTAHIPGLWWKGMLATLLKSNEQKLEKEGLVPINATQMIDSTTRRVFDIPRLMNSKYEDLSNEERRVCKNLGVVFGDKTSRALFRNAIANDENMDRNPNLNSDQKFLKARIEWSATPDILMPVQSAPTWWDSLRGNWSSFDLEKNPNFLRDEMDKSFKEMNEKSSIDQFLDRALTLKLPTNYTSVIPGENTFKSKFKPQGTVGIEAAALAKQKVSQLLLNRLREINLDISNITEYLNDRSSTITPSNLKKQKELAKQQTSALHQLEKLSIDEPELVSQGQLRTVIRDSELANDEYKSAIDHDILDHSKTVNHVSIDPRNKIEEGNFITNSISSIYRMISPNIDEPSDPFSDDENDDDAKGSGLGGRNLVKKSSPEMWYAPHHTIVLHIEPNKTYTMCTGKKGGQLQSILPLWDSNIELRGHPTDNLIYNLENNWFHVTRDPNHNPTTHTHCSLNPNEVPVLDQLNNITRNQFHRECPKATDKVKIIGQLQMTQPTSSDDHLVRTYKFFGVAKLTQAPIVSLYKSSSKIDIMNDEFLNSFLSLRETLIPIHLKQEENHVLPLMTFITTPKVFY